MPLAGYKDNEDFMEKLYNNILLSEDYSNTPASAQSVPYLKDKPEVIDVTVGRQLFVDGFLIAKTTLTPTYHKAKKYLDNPVLFPKTSWEKEDASPVACPKSGGVWYDEAEGIYKMWYEAGWLRHMCYAISSDGIHWERPALDVEEGTNKILTYQGFEEEKCNGDITYLRPDSTTVWIDYASEDKYKLFLKNPGGKKAPGIVATSRDGVHFENFTFTGKMNDRSTVFYNPFRKKWVYSIRAIWWTGEEKKNWIRARNFRECDDLLDGAAWGMEDEKKWMSADERDLPQPDLNFPPQLYNVDCIGYESIMLGFAQILYGPENADSEKRGLPKITALIPMYSRDGYHFSRPCRDRFIASENKPGSWDRGYVQSVSGGVILLEDEIRIYYTGFAGDEAHKNENWVHNGMYHNGATGFATLRRDGFVSLDGEGFVLTEKITFRGKKDMYINARGKVRVEILDDKEFVLATAIPFDGDSTCARLDFGSFCVSDLNEKVIRLRFFVSGSLYSFGFADEKGDFGGARAAGLVK